MNKDDSGGRAKIGLVLVALGSVEHLSWCGVYSFLSALLSDRCVVSLPRVFWLPFLHTVVLPLRCGKILKDYREIWNHEHNASPLRFYTRQQACLLSDLLKKARRNEDWEVTWAFRHGSPSISDRLRTFSQAQCFKEIAFLPLYPQYARATTGSVRAAIQSAVRTMIAPPNRRHQPLISIVRPFYAHPSYIGVLVDRIQAAINELSWEPEVVLLSFHGLPRKEIDRGDPYEQHCQLTAKLVQTGLPGQDVRISYQSRFGFDRWLGPSTTDSIRQMAQNGVKNLLVLAPSFMSDCLETLGEIDRDARKTFVMHGGVNFHFLPCLNDKPDGILALSNILSEREHLPPEPVVR